LNLRLGLLIDVAMVMVVGQGRGQRSTGRQEGNCPSRVGLAGGMDGDAMAGHPLHKSLPRSLGYQGGELQLK
jgi:hypothetical protein